MQVVWHLYRLNRDNDKVVYYIAFELRTWRRTLWNRDWSLKCTLWNNCWLLTNDDMHLSYLLAICTGMNYNGMLTYNCKYVISISIIISFFFSNFLTSCFRRTKNLCRYRYTWRNVQTEYCEKNCILTFTNIANLKLQWDVTNKSQNFVQIES